MRSCNVNNFWIDIYYDNVVGGTLLKNTVRSDVTQGGGIVLSRGSNNLLQDNNAVTRPGYGGNPIYLSGSSSNTLINNYGESWHWIGIVLWDLNGQGSDNNVLTGNTGIAEADGIILWRSHNNKLNGNTGTGTGNPGRGIYLVGANGNSLSGNTGIATASSSYIGVVGIDLIWSSNNVLDNNIANSQGGRGIGVYGDTTYGAANNNLFTGNTVFSPFAEVRISGNAASGNVFYRNVFTDTAGLYVQDETSGNQWDSGISGSRRQGNYWPNVLTGAVQVIDQAPGNGWGDCGSGFPYSQATSQGKFVGPGADNAPATNLIGDCGLKSRGKAR